MTFKWNGLSSISTQAIKLLTIFKSSSLQNPAFISTTQYAMKNGQIVANGDFWHLHSAYPAKCGIHREALQNNNIKQHCINAIFWKVLIFHDETRIPIWKMIFNRKLSKLSQTIQRTFVNYFRSIRNFLSYFILQTLLFTCITQILLAFTQLFFFFILINVKLDFFIILMNWHEILIYSDYF